MGFLKNMMDLSVELKRSFENHIESEIDLTYPQWRVMRTIRYSGSDISANEVANIIGFDKVTVSAIVNRLINKGYLEKEVDPNDRRRNVLYISKKAHTMCEKVGCIEEKFNRKIFMEIEDDEMKAYLKTTEKLLDKVKSINEYND